MIINKILINIIIIFGIGIGIDIGICIGIGNVNVNVGIIKNEDAIEFANRVKHEIALKGGLVDLVWDGNLKRQQVDYTWCPNKHGN